MARGPPGFGGLASSGKRALPGVRGPGAPLGRGGPLFPLFPGPSLWGSSGDGGGAPRGPRGPFPGGAPRGRAGGRGRVGVPRGPFGPPVTRGPPPWLPKTACEWGAFENGLSPRPFFKIFGGF